MPSDHLSHSPKSQASSTNDTARFDPLDGAVLKLAAQAAFLEAFATGLSDVVVPVEKVAPAGGETDLGWNAGLGL